MAWDNELLFPEVADRFWGNGSGRLGRLEVAAAVRRRLTARGSVEGFLKLL
jgi:hypothetical protein